MRRSGTHAVIYWILAHEADKYFFNDMQHPFKPVQVINRLRRPLPMHKKLIVANWENKVHWAYGQDPKTYKDLGYSEKKTVLVMRDPFNWLASYMEKRWGINDQLLDQLDIHAQEFFGKTNHIPDKICVDFNQWFSSIDYRKSISEKLGYEFTDRGLNRVGSEGGGSSFDKREFNGDGQKMKVLDRWKKYQNNDRYWRILRSRPFILEMAKQWPELYETFKHKLNQHQK